MTDLILVPQIYYNVKRKNAAVDGTTDDTTAIQNSINAVNALGGGFVFIPGLSAISSPLSLPSKVGLISTGFGANSTSPTSLYGGLIATSGFSGAEMVNIATADGTSIRDFMFVGGPNSTSASNPGITAAIEVTSSRYPWIQNVHFYYVNGLCIEGVGGASINNVGAQIQQIHMEHTAKGIHWKGVSGSSYVGQAFFSNIHAEVIDNGDALFLEDINDIKLSNIDGAVAGGATSGSMLHIKGNCASHFYSNVDLGAITQSTVSPTVLIETSSNGSPSNIVIANGVLQKGSVGVQITDGSNIIFKNVTFKSANTDNVEVSGSTVGTPIEFECCTFQTGNQSGGTAYDINLTHSTGFSYARNCILQSPVASSTPGSVTNPANDTNHRGYFFGTHFAGSNTTPSTCFNGSPQIIRSCPGYNPRGQITAPSIGASPATVSSSQNDLVMQITTLNGLTGLTINGTSYVPQINVPYPWPARSNAVFTYGAGGAPVITANAQ